MVGYLIVVLLFCLIPAGVIWLCNRIAILGKLGPIMVLYAIGMVIGNLPFMPVQMKEVQDMLPNVLIPLAIPMMLYGCAFSTRQAGLQLKIVLSGFLSVGLAVAISYLLFGSQMEQGNLIGGIISGMYTGGTLNAAAIQAVFRVDSESFILINSYDIIISFSYFVFLFVIGIRMFRKLLGEKKTGISSMEQDMATRSIEMQSRTSYRKLLTKEGLQQLLKILGVTVIVAGVSAGVALLCPQEWFMVIFILMITTLGVACSFIPKVKKLDLSYDAGMYLIYIFSITIASMADFSNLDLEKGINLFLFLAVAVFASLTLHAIFCRMMKVDADSMVISSVAFINSPPFVPMVSAAMKNRDALVTGLAAGVVGYALGNHFGILMAQLLSFVQ